ncbi:hypothetical protein OQX61_08280 [Pedobacter sp. PLR]|uniref:hypothetical protein n=1 Tax=Pedobacter sp. PLR TaxID=2994465 RepID=UPI0022485AF3|nr:hypothetical protein [Pedobacter sp. PLR]MCX2451265.1 hypothetical protein [Pedobacter sp. PLR]
MTTVGKRNEKGLKTTYLNFDLIYFIQLKRIASRFSQEELSFLMGRKKGFIADREAFKLNKELWLGDVSALAKIFDCHTVDFFRSIDGYPKEIRLWAVQSQEQDYIQYKVYQLHEEHPMELLYMLNEMDPGKRYLENEESAFLYHSRIELSHLIMEGFFDVGPKTPLEIFKICRIRAGHLIKAGFLEQALGEYLDAEGQGLKKYKHKDMGFVYEAV